jgi:excinuclease ABC subunit C
MKRANGEVLYVGKAKNLRSRVGSYFNNSAKSPKTEILVGHIESFDFQMTETESEALVLENNLIKKFKPRYNILMRDDKSYPYLVVDTSEPFPRLNYQRRVKRGKNKLVFGPFVVGSNIGEVLRTVTKLFSLRDCSLREFHSRKEACLLYQIHQCSAPCVDKISPEEYDQDLKEALSIFKGQGKKALRTLSKKMMDAAEAEMFEKAALLRDGIAVIEEFVDFSAQRNAELKDSDQNLDIFAYQIGESEIDLSVYMIRDSILLGHKNFHFICEDLSDESEEDEILKHLFQYYSLSHDSLPNKIICSFSEEKREVLGSALNSYLDSDISVIEPKGKYQSLFELTQEHVFETQRVRTSQQDSELVGLNKLKELLKLKERPVIMECYDVAVFQGSSPTASQIVYRDGVAEPKEYRYYHLEEHPEGNNDFAMMKEVMRRRLDNGKLPDVIVVDGGHGQINVVAEVLKEFELSIPIVGVAKSRVKKSRSSFKSKEVNRSEERLVIPGRMNPYQLSKNKSLFKIVTTMRDEAHRFSRKLHHGSEQKKLISSWLDCVSGIGPKTRQKILKDLKLTKDEVSLLNVNEIKTELGVSQKIAQSIYDYLKNDS